MLPLSGALSSATERAVSAGDFASEVVAVTVLVAECRFV